MRRRAKVSAFVPPGEGWIPGALPPVKVGYGFLNLPLSGSFFARLHVPSLALGRRCPKLRLDAQLVRLLDQARMLWQTTVSATTLAATPAEATPDLTSAVLMACRSRSPKKLPNPTHSEPIRLTTSSSLST